MNCTIHLDDAVNCRIIGLSSEDYKHLYDKFGIFIDGHFHHPKVQLRIWDGKIRFFSMTGATYVNLLPEIVPLLINWKYDLNIQDHRHNVIKVEGEIDDNIFGLDDFKLRDYQVGVVNSLLNEGSGLAICATGAGKTSMCAAISLILHINDIQTLIIVPSTDLVRQTIADFEDKLQNYPISIGEYSGARKDLDHPIVVATWQSLQNVPHLMERFQGVIVDECFSGAMKVSTPDGQKRIDELKIGDKVYSHDGENIIEDEIVKVHISLEISKNELMKRICFFNGSVIEATANHKIYTENRGMVRIDEITKDDKIITNKGLTSLFMVYKMIHPEATYNLHVKENHNYFVENVLVSNCHGAKAQVIKNLLEKYGGHIHARYGVTGTLPKSETDRTTIECLLGKPHVEIPASWLIEQGFLAKIEIQPYETMDKVDLPDWSSEKTFLTTCGERNDTVADIIMENRDKYGNTLILVNSIKQGKMLQKLIPDSVFLSGDSKSDLRAENYGDFADQNDIIRICTMGIASTGISIDRIFCLIFVDIGKSYIKCIQAVGRGLRKKGDKNFIHVADIHSKLKFSKKHFNDRKKYYKEASYPVNKSIKVEVNY